MSGKYMTLNLKISKQPLNIFQLQKEIKNKYEEEKLLSRINCQNHIFDKKMVNMAESVFEYCLETFGCLGAHSLAPP